MKYKVIRENYNGFEEVVNQHLDEGWELHGIPMITNNNVLMQAMTLKPKYEENEIIKNEIELLKSTEVISNPDGTLKIVAKDINNLPEPSKRGRKPNETK